MSDPRGATKEVALSLTVDEINLVLEGIGQLPFVRVYALVAKIQQQAQQQLAQRTEGERDAR